MEEPTADIENQTPAGHPYRNSAPGAGVGIGIVNTSATAVQATSATLTGTNSYFDVWAFWGLADGTNNAGAWASSNYVGGITLSGATTSSSIAYNAASGISHNLLHYYTFRASNAATNFWASPS